MFFKKSNIFTNVLLPLILGVLLLYVYEGRIRSAADIGLGEGTASYFPAINNYPIHISNPIFTDSVLAGWKQRGQKQLFLWQGNSQIHGVNQYKPGEVNCVKFLFDSLSSNNEEVIGASYPNGNMQEFLVSLIYFSNKSPIKTVIQPVFFDDLREDGIRNEISIPDVLKGIKNDSIYFRNIRSIQALTSNDTLNESPVADDFSGIHATAQERSERYLEEKLANSWTIWKRRPDMRGNLFNDAFLFRNMALGIKPNSVRKMIRGRYDDNYNAFLNMLNFCKDRKIRLIIYIPPLRNDVAPPYDVADYTKFKKDVQADCEKFNMEFINLEGLVPAKYWGLKASTSMGGSDEIDFMHFQQSGHQLIADTIYKTLRKALSK